MAAFGCLGEVSTLFSFGFLLHQGPKVSAGQVGVRHCGAQISMAHGFLHVHGILSLGQPCGYPPVPEVVILMIWVRLDPVNRTVIS